MPWDSVQCKSQRKYLIAARNKLNKYKTRHTLRITEGTERKTRCKDDRLTYKTETRQPKTVLEINKTTRSFRMSSNTNTILHRFLRYHNPNNSKLTSTQTPKHTNIIEQSYRSITLKEVDKSISPLKHHNYVTW